MRLFATKTLRLKCQKCSFPLNRLFVYHCSLVKKIKPGVFCPFFDYFGPHFPKIQKNAVDFSQFCLWFFSRENTALNFAENIQCILLSHVALQRSTSAEIENFQLCWLWRNSLNNPLLARECFYSGDKLRSAEKVWNCRFINPRFSELVSEEEL